MEARGTCRCLGGSEVSLRSELMLLGMAMSVNLSPRDRHRAALGLSCASMLITVQPSCGLLQVSWDEGLRRTIDWYCSRDVNEHWEAGVEHVLIPHPKHLQL